MRLFAPPKIALKHAFVLFLLAAVPVAAADRTTLEGHWEGSIEAPGQPLEIDLDFALSGDAWTGDISIPAQGIQDRALTEIEVEEDTARFKIPDIPGAPSFDGTFSEGGDRFSGTFSQGGASLDFELRRDDRSADKARAALEDFDSFVEQAIADWNVPGTAIAVVVDDDLVYAKGFGYRDVEAKLPMSADSLFAIGSTSKAFTATTLGMLVDQGKLDWDGRLRDYLPTFQLKDPLASELMTPRDLVTHRSGLPRHDMVWYNNNEVTRADLVARLEHLEPSADFRQKFQYNNLMFLTAGYLVEQLSGKTWEEAVDEMILSPLGMDRTTFTVHDSQKDSDHAKPYRETEDGELERIPFRDISLIGPAGSINSSVNEMSHWLRLNLRGGSLDQEQLIQKATLADIHAPHMAIPTPPQRPEIQPGGYGLGWSIDTYRGHRRVSHGGGIDGFITAVAIFPDDQLGVVTFTNIGSGLPSILRNHAVDRVLGLEPIDWNSEALEDRKKSKEANEKAAEKKDEMRRDGTAPSHPLAEYAGDFENEGYGSLSVSLDGDLLSLEYNGITTPLEHWHYDVWSGAEASGDPTFEDTKFQFRSDVDGNIASVEARLEPSVDPIAFRKKGDASLSDPEYLERLVGKYQLNDQTGEVKLSGSELTLSLAGQPTLTLTPDLGGKFRLKEAATITVAFEVPETGPATKVTFFQPNGVFEATRIEE